MPQFKVGDAVRVKAGSLVYGHMPHFTLHAAPYERSFGKMLLITGKNNSQFPPANSPYGHWECLDRSTGRIDWVTGDYLEPWNDAEEWNGTAWVAKKKSEPKPAIVAKRGSCVLEKIDSTNAAVRRAEQLANADPGTEYIVYQEKASFKVDQPSKAEMLAEELRNVKEKRVQAKGEWYDLDGIDVEVSGNVVTARYHVKS